MFPIMLRISDSLFNESSFSSFGTDCPKEAQKRAEAKGLTVEWGEGGYMKTRFTISGFEYFPQLDRNLLYSAIADHGSWFDTWPGMAELEYMKEYKNASSNERPLAITFGDGEEMTREGIFRQKPDFDFYMIFQIWSHL